MKITHLYYIIIISILYINIKHNLKAIKGISSLKVYQDLGMYYYDAQKLNNFFLNETYNNPTIIYVQ